MSALKRILIADDNPHVAHILRQGITRVLETGCDIHTVPDGESALAELRGGEVDLVILDLYMPKLDGQSVIDRVRADPELSALRILVVTAGGPEAAEDALERGADEALHKPLRLVDVADAVRRLLRVD